MALNKKPKVPPKAPQCAPSSSSEGGDYHRHVLAKLLILSPIPDQFTVSKRMNPRMWGEVREALLLEILPRDPQYGEQLMAHPELYNPTSLQAHINGLDELDRIIGNRKTSPETLTYEIEMAEYFRDQWQREFDQQSGPTAKGQKRRREMVDHYSLELVKLQAEFTRNFPTLPMPSRATSTRFGH
jgi:hypothetical protein